MLKSKQFDELGLEIVNLQQKLDELINKKKSLNKLCVDTVDEVLNKKYSTNCSGLYEIIQKQSNKRFNEVWRNGIEAGTLRDLAKRFHGGLDQTEKLIENLITHNILIEKFCWLDCEYELHFLDDGLQEHMRNVVTYQTTGVDNFPDAIEDFEKTPFDPIAGEDCSLDLMVDGMIPIFYVTDGFMTEIEQAEKYLVESGKFLFM